MHENVFYINFEGARTPEDVTCRTIKLGLPDIQVTDKQPYCQVMPSLDCKYETLNNGEKRLRVVVHAGRKNNPTVVDGFTRRIVKITNAKKENAAMIILGEESKVADWIENAIEWYGHTVVKVVKAYGSFVWNIICCLGNTCCGGHRRLQNVKETAASSDDLHAMNFWISVDLYINWFERSTSTIENVMIGQINIPGDKWEWSYINSWVFYSPDCEMRDDEYVCSGVKIRTGDSSRSIWMSDHRFD